MSLSNRTIDLLADAFFSGSGPTHRKIDAIWQLNGAGAYLLPEAEANKHDRVLYGLRWLRDGRGFADQWVQDLPGNEARLRTVTGELAAALVEGGHVDVNRLAEALA